MLYLAEDLLDAVDESLAGDGVGVANLVTIVSLLVLQSREEGGGRGDIAVWCSAVSWCVVQCCAVMCSAVCATSGSAFRMVGSYMPTRARNW